MSSLVIQSFTTTAGFTPQDLRGLLAAVLLLCGVMLLVIIAMQSFHLWSQGQFEGDVLMLFSRALMVFLLLVYVIR